MVGRLPALFSIAAVATLPLFGCAHSRYVEHPITAWFTAPEAPSAAPSADPAQAHCRELAGQRTRDAAFQGEDEATRHDVYRRSLDDCLSWAARHAAAR
ncbi:MAG TPA: hypothetical protein VG889_08700 [Rhizomicrobium sp.]|nr:hypothetical protein [Rhizomicrobium sp.]